MSLKTAYTELANAITGDADVQAWVTSVGGSLVVLKGNREVGVIDVRELPALVLEVGKWPLEPEVAGQVSYGRHEMHCSLVWEEQDEETGYERAVELPELLAKALMNNPTLNGSVDGAWLSGIEPDYGYFHPRHSMGFTVSADMTISR